MPYVRLSFWPAPTPLAPVLHHARLEDRKTNLELIVQALPDSEFRLNMLLTDAQQPWAENLPRLLQPQGVRAIGVTNVDQALNIIDSEPIHAAVIDLSMPMAEAKPARASRDAFIADGLKLLRVIHRLDPAPPAVVVRGRRFDGRVDDRLLAQALKLDAFSVLDQPVDLEQLLQVLRRLIERYYGGSWPRAGFDG